MAANSSLGRGRMPYLHHDNPDNEPDDAYKSLPEPIKLVYSRAEWLWLSDAQKARLVDEECEPEW